MAADSSTHPESISTGSPIVNNGIELSVCIVAYQAKDYLRACLDSLLENTHQPSFEVIVVNNGSSDGTHELLATRYPQVILIENEKNLGYTRPMNQALRASHGKFLLQLNPDTIVLPNALDLLVNFMQEHPSVGICGPKVLNQNGTLQGPCKRGEARPWAVISYYLGLSKLFPKSKLFGGYLLNYLDEDATNPVAGVSGSCMLIRREVINQISYLDENYFAFQEDADFCFRTRQSGWEVYYYPEAKIVHYGGQGGSRVEPYRSIIEWHRSYFLFYRKHLAKDYFFIFNWIYYLLMIVKLGLTLLVNLFRKEKSVGPKRV
jgi:hypothetical protein